MTKIPSEALAFLQQLEKHNNREWFNEHKPHFKALEKQMKGFYATLEGLLLKHDDIQKTKAFRIYRDVRFSKDKTPYKTHFAASFTRRKPQLRGGYYLHIAPGNRSFLGVGFWNPGAEDLKRVRKEWELDAGEIEKVLNNKNLKQHWGTLQGERLKSAPAGFNREHPNIGLINFKSWTFNHCFSDKEVLDERFAHIIDEYYQAIRPFFDYMTEVLTTDMNGASLL